MARTPDHELSPERLRRRLYARRHAQRQRERELAVRRRGRSTCPARRGHYGECGGVLEDIVRRDGTVVTICPRCERKKKGVCQDCGQRVDGQPGKALRCAHCKHVERNRASRRHYGRHREAELRAQKRRRAWERQHAPDRYAHHLAVKKAWRARNVVRIKLQKRKWRLNPDRPNGYSSREKYDDYHRRYREAHRAHYRELAHRKAEARRAARGAIVCACGCGRAVPWDGRYRPRKWLSEHDPWPRPLTSKEVVMKASARAVEILERAADKVRAKLADVRPLEQELKAIENAIATLKPVAGEAPARRGRKSAAAAA